MSKTVLFWHMYLNNFWNLMFIIILFTVQSSSNKLFQLHQFSLKLANNTLAWRKYLLEQKSNYVLINLCKINYLWLSICEQNWLYLCLWNIFSFELVCLKLLGDKSTKHKPCPTQFRLFFYDIGNPQPLPFEYALGKPYVRAHV